MMALLTDTLLRTGPHAKHFTAVSFTLSSQEVGKNHS